MEILSKGEKIKRARVYKGFTLKEVCSDKISVSKLSCIENDKVEPEDEILEYIADKLDLDLEYLKQDINEHLEENYRLLRNSQGNKDYKQKIEYNLKIARNYGYYDMAFKFMHLLFTYYINNDFVKEVQLITSDYYDICQRAYTEENRIVYYCDMSRYCFINKEYIQAINYCSNIREFFKVKGDSTDHYLIVATYNQIACHVMLKEYDKAFEISSDLEEIIECEKQESKKADMYHMMAILCLRKDKDKFKKYEKKSYELYENDEQGKAIAIYNYASTMFEIDLKEEAIDYIKRSLKSFPKHNKIELVDFMLSVVEELIDNEVLDFAKEVCDEVLNYAIEVDKIEFIEKAYYYRSKILIKNGQYAEAEIYMNLCLDALIKFGNNNQIYKRYLEMGNMYYNMNNLKDALKYFNLAIKLEEKL